MAHYKIENLSFTYPQSTQPALDHISFSVPSGAFMLIGGPTGSGKTTLLQLLKKQVQPAGNMTGEIFYEGTNLKQMDERRSAEEIGMIFQNPDNQIVMNTVWQELCFGMENLGYPAALMQKRMAEVVPFFGMESWLHQSIETLSGGQKQLLNLAAVMMLRPKMLLLDEPTAQLDPIATSEFTDMLTRINQEFSITIVMCEHRLDDLYSRVNQVLLMEEGRIAYQGDSVEILHQIWEDKKTLFRQYLPTVSRLYLQLQRPDGEPQPIPVTVKEGKAWFERYYSQYSHCFADLPTRIPAEMEKVSPALLQCREVSFQYGKSTPQILKNLSLDVCSRDFFALLGGNGSGKSTMLKIIAGALQHQRGSIRYMGKQITSNKIHHLPGQIGYVAQNPMAYFSRDSVAEQLDDRQSVLGNTDPHRLEEMIELFGLQPLLHRHPFDLSGGQQQKLVLALALLSDPELLLLDEPTKGLDPQGKECLASWLERLRQKGKAVLMVSHDIDFAARHANKCGLLFDGKVMAVEEPAKFFTDNYYYTTAVYRTVRTKLGSAVTEREVLARWQG